MDDNKDCGCTLKSDATIKERLYDFLGGYTILYNGTICESRANQPKELSFLHKKEVVNKSLKIFESKLRQLEKELQEKNYVLESWYKIFETSQLSHAHDRLKAAEDGLARSEFKVKLLEKENQKLEAEKSSAEKVLISVGRDYGDVAEEITKLLKENSEWQGKHLKIEAENSEMRDILKDTEFGLEDCRVCYSNRYEGHDKNCRLSKILKGKK